MPDSGTTKRWVCHELSASLSFDVMNMRALDARTKSSGRPDSLNIALPVPLLLNSIYESGLPLLLLKAASWNESAPTACHPVPELDMAFNVVVFG